MTAVDVDALAKLREALSEALGQLAMRGGYGIGVLASERLAADLLPVVDRIAAERAAAEREWLAEFATEMINHPDDSAADWGYDLAYRLGLLDPDGDRIDVNGCPDRLHHGVDCPGDACRYALDPT